MYVFLAFVRQPSVLDAGIGRIEEKEGTGAQAQEEPDRHDPSVQGVEGPEFPMEKSDEKWTMEKAR
jgi:hypothetical protein